MKLNKKAFTVVELVIVIAIIAILAAVLIPTFANMINKANIAKDTQLIRNLNTALASSRASNNNDKHKTLYDALQAADAFGYDIGKINASATNAEILWDQENDVFCYLEGTNIVYLPELVESLERLSLTTRPYHLWKIFNDKDTFLGDGKNPHGFSIYWNGSALDDTVPVDLDGIGFDAGTASVSKISYSNNDNKNVVIRTNGGSLTIDAASDTVNHYGYVEVLDVQAIACASYNEYGTTGFARIKQGHFVVESEGIVNVLYATGTKTGDTAVKVDNNSGIIGKAYAIDDSIANYDTDGETPKQDGNVVLIKDESVTTQVIAAVTANNIAETVATNETLKEVVENSSFRGEGTEASPYLISNENELMILSEKSKNDSFESKYFRLERNLDMDSFNWIPIGSSDNKPFKGTFLGNNKVILNLTGQQGGLIQYAGTGLKIENTTLANINVSGSKVGGFINTTTKTNALNNTSAPTITLNNCDISSGSITSTDKLGGLIGECYGTSGASGILNVNISNCDINLDKLESSSYRVGGLFGYISSWTGNINECTVTANVISTFTGKRWVGGFAAGIGGDVSIAVSDFTFNGNTNNNLVASYKDKDTDYNKTVSENISILNSSNKCLIGCISNLSLLQKPKDAENPVGIYEFVWSSNDFTFNGHTGHSYYISWSDDANKGNIYYFSTDANSLFFGPAGHLSNNYQNTPTVEQTNGSTDPICNIDDNSFLKLIFVIN